MKMNSAEDRVRSLLQYLYTHKPSYLAIEVCRRELGIKAGGYENEYSIDMAKLQTSPEPFYDFVRLMKRKLPWQRVLTEKGLEALLLEVVFLQEVDIEDMARRFAIQSAKGKLIREFPLPLRQEFVRDTLSDALSLQSKKRLNAIARALKIEPRLYKESTVAEILNTLGMNTTGDAVKKAVQRHRKYKKGVNSSGL